MVSRKRVDNQVMNHEKTKEKRERRQGVQRMGAKERKEKSAKISQWSMSQLQAWIWEFALGKTRSTITSLLVYTSKLSLTSFSLRTIFARCNCAFWLDTRLQFSHLLSGTKRRITGMNSAVRQLSLERAMCPSKEAGPRYAKYAGHVD